MNIEPLEARIAPAAVLTYTDVDGDAVTVTTSKGTNTDLAAILTLVTEGLGKELQVIDFSQNAAIFAGTNLTVTAKRTVVGGDGLANVGYIDAEGDFGGTALDLGLVTIKGDLGQIDAGDGDTSTAALKGLTVQSLGLFGTSTQPAGYTLNTDILGALGFLKVAGSVKEAYILVAGTGPDGTAGAKIGPVTIGGSLIGGAANESGKLSSAGPIGAVKIGGDIQGGSGGFSGRIRALGTLASVTLGGSLLGGSSADSGEIFVDNAMCGAVKIAGNIEGGSGAYSGSIQVTGALASLTLGGSLLGGSNFETGEILSNGAMGPVKITGNIEGGVDRASGRVHTDSTLASLTLGGSLFGASNNNTGEITSVGAMGAVKIGGNIEGGGLGNSGQLSQTGFISGARIASLFVGGSIISGVTSGGLLDDSGAVRATDDIGAITIKGSLIGNRDNPVLITARGQATPGATSDVAIKSLSVAGRVERAEILAGYDQSNDPVGVNADAQIGAVVVGGDWIASNLVAGVQDDATPVHTLSFGNDDDQKITGGTDTGARVSKIASILIKGTALGTVETATNDTFGFVAQEIGSFTVGGTKFLLGRGAASASDTAGLLVGPTFDLRVREVAL